MILLRFATCKSRRTRRPIDPKPESELEAYRWRLRLDWCSRAPIALRAQLGGREVLGPSELMASKNSGSSVRFAVLVEKSGRPQVYTLWSEPDQDAEFMNAVKENRVITVFQPAVGTKRDYAKVGFHKERQASYLVFPKALSYAEGVKVIGIKYDLLASPPPAPAGEKSVADSASKSERPDKASQKRLRATVEPVPEAPEEDMPKALEHYRAVIRITVVREVQVELEAADVKGAKARAIDQIRAGLQEQGEVRLSVRSVQKL